MLTYRVKSLPLKEVISDLAAEFHTTFKEECDLFTLSLPPYIGKGTIRGINFSNGLGILIYDCMFNDDVRIEFTFDQVHPMKYLYCLQGEAIHKFADDESEKHELLKYLNIIVASKSYGGHILEFKKQVKTQINSLEINRIDFKEQFDCKMHDLDSGLRNALLDVSGENNFLFLGDYSLKTANIFQDIEVFPYEAFLRKGFLHAKAWEILVFQTIQYNSKLNKETILDRSDKNIQIVREAADKIDQDFLSYDTIDSLAAEFDISGTRLQQIFKKYHHTTLHNYMMSKRMELIVDMLENTQYSLKEICELTGIKSQSYLSKIFQKEYGITPSSFRK